MEFVGQLMALTATFTFHKIKERLSLEHPVLVSTSPFRNNIPYVVSPKEDLDHFCSIKDPKALPFLEEENGERNLGASGCTIYEPLFDGGCIHGC